jgi:hypothetical protein
VTTSSETEVRIRTALFELAAATPLRNPEHPQMRQDAVLDRQSSVPRRVTKALPRRQPEMSGKRRGIIGLALASLLALAVLVVLLVWPSRSPASVTEAELGMQQTSATRPISNVPDGYAPVASGTVFGVRWQISGLASPSQQICVALAYRGSLAINPCGSATYSGVDEAGSKVHRAGLTMGLWTAPDKQRFLVAVTSGSLTSLTVQSNAGTTVRGSPVLSRIGHTRYFVLSLGKEGGPCYELCQGAVGVRASTGGVVVEINGAISLRISDYEGSSGYLGSVIKPELGR